MAKNKAQAPTLPRLKYMSGVRLCSKSDYIPFPTDFSWSGYLVLAILQLTKIFLGIFFRFKACPSGHKPQRGCEASATWLNCCSSVCVCVCVFFVFLMFFVWYVGLLPRARVIFCSSAVLLLFFFLFSVVRRCFFQMYVAIVVIIFVVVAVAIVAAAAAAVIILAADFVAVVILAWNRSFYHAQCPSWFIPVIRELKKKLIKTMWSQTAVRKHQNNRKRIKAIKWGANVPGTKTQQKPNRTGA